MDLRKLSQLCSDKNSVKKAYAPHKPDDPKLTKKISDLRDSGVVVVLDFGMRNVQSTDLDCGRLVLEGDNWVLK